MSKWSKFVRPPTSSWFQEGGWNMIDDRSGEKLKASTTSLQWDRMRTRKPQVRHPQDFLRATPERIRTPWTRIAVADNFVNGAFVPTNDAGSGSTEI